MCCNVMYLYNYSILAVLYVNHPINYAPQCITHFGSNYLPNEDASLDFEPCDFYSLPSPILRRICNDFLS